MAIFSQPHPLPPLQGEGQGGVCVLPSILFRAPIATYFGWLVRYILLNPVKAGLVPRPEEWKFSSAGDVLGTNVRTWLDTEQAVMAFGNSGELRRFLLDSRVSEPRFWDPDLESPENPEDSENPQGSPSQDSHD